jgi:hypothetical protein
MALGVTASARAMRTLVSGWGFVVTPDSILRQVA